MDDFKVIKDYENYSINSEGKVFSIKFNRFLKPAKNSNGYLFVNLVNAQKIKKTHSVHKLVMLHFGSPKPDENFIIDHIDGDKANSKIQNLQWITVKENTTKYYDNFEKKNLIVELYKSGLKIKEIIERVGLSDYTVRQTVHKFRAGIL